MSQGDEVIDQTQRAMLKRKGIMWGSALVILVWLFFWGVPINYMKSMLTLLAILASISITACVVMVFFSIMFFFVPNKKDNPKEGYIIFGIILLVFFGTGVLMIIQEMHREKVEITNYGEITDATVVDGSSFSTRRIDFTNVKLIFTMINGEEYTVYHDIPHINFDKFYEGQHVIIVYSTKHPTILEVIYSKQELDYYKKIINGRSR